ncbi:Alpha-(1,3)-fucosyltransferase C, partial [Armadillidium nasatum]
NFSKFQNRNFLIQKFLKIDRNENQSEIILGNKKIFIEEDCLITYNESEYNNNLRKPENFDFLITEEGKKYKKILFYYFAYGKNYGFGIGRDPFACCKEKRCFMTDNKDKIPHEEFDAVIIHFKGLKKKNLPKKRSRHQRYIFYESEPPPMSGGYPQNFEGIFNWTLTYRRDSDILFGYGTIYNKKIFTHNDIGQVLYSSTLQSVMKTKNKLVAWSVDIYGKCGEIKCPRKDELKCRAKYEREYKFYLSFENNFCKDYITEKFFLPFSYYIVPIVRGSGDYASIAPPHSYINVNDFKSVKDLADYLIYLDRNDTAYMEYFNYKKDYVVLNKLTRLYLANPYCSLCEKLHNDKTEKVHNNLAQWFKEEAQCNKDLGNF